MCGGLQDIGSTMVASDSCQADTSHSIRIPLHEFARVKIAYGTEGFKKRPQAICNGYHLRRRYQDHAVVVLTEGSQAVPMRRELVLGLSCDGPTWPETASGAPVSLGCEVVGPRGLLSALETAIGLLRPDVPGVRRIALMRAKLAQAAAGNDRFWSKSLIQDSWATARRLLRWRDDLVAAGWKPGNAWLGRLAELAFAERSGPAMLPGADDRLCGGTGQHPWPHPPFHAAHADRQRGGPADRVATFGVCLASVRSGDRRDRRPHPRLG